MKINIDMNIFYEVDDSLVDNYLDKNNITLKEYKELTEKEMYEFMNDEFGEEDMNNNIQVKVYFEKECGD